MASYVHVVGADYILSEGAGSMSTLPETNMETQKGPYNDYRPSKKGAIWVSMLVWGSVIRGKTTLNPKPPWSGIF